VSFDLFLFSVNEETIRSTVDAGVAGVVVDWEHRGKEARQAEADTEINRNTQEDLERVRRSTGATVLCRINGPGPWNPEEVQRAVLAGADEVLVPMVRSPEDVEPVLNAAGGRCGVGILVETVDAVARLPELVRLPLTRFYVGLNDLAIERGTASIFAPLADGTLDEIRRHVAAPFGFGGLTIPERGHPIPCRLLMAEMARLGSEFTFLRRSFHRDVAGTDPGSAIPPILRAMEAAKRRAPEEVERDRSSLVDALSLQAVPEPGRS
jgi:hypothetical protein